MFWYPLVLTVLRLSAAGSIAIAVVLLARPLLKKAPRWLTCALWLVVLIRLLIPVSFEGFFGVVPKSVTQLDETVYYPAYEQVTPGAAADAALRTVGDALNGGIGTVPVRLTPDAVPDTSAVPAYHRQVWPLVLTALWPIGVLAMAAYAIVSYLRLRKKLVGAVKLEGNVYLADNIPSPFVLGMLRPKIYLPSTLTPAETEYILLHERTHLSHLDHITRPLAFLALTVHWFNPLVWLAFVVSGVDMEVACDEDVLDKAGADIRADYAQSLLNLSTGRILIAATPLAFGEGNVKDRVKNVLKYKRPRTAVLLCALFLLSFLNMALLTDRAEAAPEPTPAPTVAATPSPTPEPDIVPPDVTEPTILDYMDAFLTAELKQDVELRRMSTQLSAYWSHDDAAPLGDISIALYDLEDTGDVLMVLYDFAHNRTVPLEIYRIAGWAPDTLYAISADSFPAGSAMAGFNGHVLYTEKAEYYYTEGTRKTYAYGPWFHYMENPDTYQFFTEENEVFSPVPIRLEQYP